MVRSHPGSPIKSNGYCHWSRPLLIANRTLATPLATFAKSRGAAPVRIMWRKVNALEWDLTGMRSQQRMRRLILASPKPESLVSDVANATQQWALTGACFVGSREA